MNVQLLYIIVQTNPGVPLAALCESVHRTWVDAEKHLDTLRRVFKDRAFAITVSALIEE